MCHIWLENFVKRLWSVQNFFHRVFFLPPTRRPFRYIVKPVCRITIVARRSLNESVLVVAVSISEQVVRRFQWNKVFYLQYRSCDIQKLLCDMLVVTFAHPPETCFIMFAAQTRRDPQISLETDLGVVREFWVWIFPLTTHHHGDSFLAFRKSFHNLQAAWVKLGHHLSKLPLFELYLLLPVPPI